LLDLLAFTHYWAMSPLGGEAEDRCADRFRRALSIASRNGVRSFLVFAVMGNLRLLRNFRHRVCGVWRKWLNRRSQPPHMTWETMERLLARDPVPQPHVLSPAT